MKRISTRSIASVFAVLVTLLTVENALAGDIKNEVEIIRANRPSIEPVEKILLKPEWPTYQKAKNIFKYEPYEANLSPEMAIKTPTPYHLPIRPKEIPLFYSRLGIGTLNTYLVDLNFNSFSSDKFLYGFDIDHHSMNDHMLVGHRFNKNVIVGFLTINNPQYRLKTEVRYKQNAFGLRSTDDTQQEYSNLDVVLGVDNANVKKKNLLYDTFLGFNSGGTNWGVREYQVRLGGTAAVKDSLGVETSLRADFLKEGGSQQHNHLLEILPYAQLGLDRACLKGGLRISTVFSSSKNAFRVYPYIDARYYVIPSSFNIFAIISGQTQPWNYLDLISSNPFVSPDLEVHNMNTKFEASLGANFSKDSFLEIISSLTYKAMDGLPVFFYDQNNEGFFAVEYFEHVGAVIFNTEAIFRLSRVVDSKLRFSFARYNAGSKDFRADYFPTFELVSTNRIELYKSLHLIVTGQYMSERAAGIKIGGATNHETLKGFLNLSTGLEYTFTRFSIFTKVNNLLNANYGLFKHYPGFDRNIVGGITIKL